MGKPKPVEQQQRLLSLTTVLGKDALIPMQVSGEESMSRCFEYRLRVFSETHHALDATDLLGSNITLALAQEDKGHETAGLRHFNGYVTALRCLGRSHNGVRSEYEISMGPWLAFLEEMTDCRVFQEKTVIELLQTVFEPLGSIAKANFDALTGIHQSHRFLVQYNESCLNFVQRWLRREGIAYFVKHQQGSHVIHFIDDGDVAPALDPQELILHPGTPGHDHLHDWKSGTGLVSGRQALSSYHYNNPGEILNAELEIPAPARQIDNALQLECHRATDACDDQTTAGMAIHWQMKHSLEGHRLVTGSGNYRFLKPGHHFRARQAVAGDWPHDGESFTLVRVCMSACNQGLAPGGGAAAFSMDFQAVPRGGLIYPRGEWPVIGSLQTAVVTGPRGTEGTVYTDHGEDRLGRIKIRFHWDRCGPGDENSSCWLRVMQNSPGHDRSAFFALPRVGDEVVVAFENGNPDRPFILGGLPNPLKQPAYAATPTRSGIRTQSFDTNGPSPDRWNELRFDDRKEHEEVFLRAEKDLTIEVHNDASSLIGNDLKLHVKQNMEHTLGGSRTTDIQGEDVCRLGGKLTIQAGESIELSVGASKLLLTPEGIEISGPAVDIIGTRTGSW